MEVEVMGSIGVGDQVKVKITQLEQKLGRKEMSRGDMLKMKLKMRK